VGRKGAAPGGPAIGVLNLDDIPPQEAIDELLGHPHVHRIKVVRLPASGELPSWLQSPSAAAK
jgi:D-3-phosphoglycerate dehydrogenase / 2-oxoglutarate reductase